jgi:phospholipid/cholesterol/gamma-HCH transport system ATP-binding protein
VFDSKTVLENIRFPLDMLTNMSNADKIERTQFCLQRVGLEHAANRMPSEISGGMKKRVGIARAIVMNPKYLFCDEPNSGLDPLTSVKIDDLIKEITDEYKITTVVITHDMNSVIGIGEYIMFLYKGYKLWEGDNTNITHSNVPELNEFLFANKLLQNVR